MFEEVRDRIEERRMGFRLVLVRRELRGKRRGKRCEFVSLRGGEFNSKEKDVRLTGCQDTGDEVLLSIPGVG